MPRSMTQIPEQTDPQEVRRAPPRQLLPRYRVPASSNVIRSSSDPQQNPQQRIQPQWIDLSVVIPLYNEEDSLKELNPATPLDPQPDESPV